MENKIYDYIKVVPNKQQKAYQDLGFNAMISYGLNTFTGEEWGDGKVSLDVFNPKHQDTDQWIEALKTAGAKGVILTCKHHDGFCLWPTKTTEYSVKNTPYKNGSGDVVKEISDSCKKFGLKFGVYLSPWDRNSEYYATPKYNDFYIEQLTELLTNYGEIFCVWLDGACGSYIDGKPAQVYDFPRIYDTIRKLQPNACISNCGPDVRWVGNEGGFARESEWNVVPSAQFNTQDIADKSQQDNDGQKMQVLDPSKEDLGSRKVLENYDDFIWYPAEVDVSVRPGWYYHKDEDDKVRSLKNLINIYFTSVGGNSLLLLNVPPNMDGLFSHQDVERLNEIGEILNKAFVSPVSVKGVEADEHKNGFDAINCTTEDDTCYAPSSEKDVYTVSLRFTEPKITDKVVLKEQCDFSQRVEKFSLYAIINGTQKKKIYQGTVIGYKKIALFNAVKADGLLLEITECRSTPHLQTFIAYEKTVEIPKYSKLELLGIKLRKKRKERLTRRWLKKQEKTKKQLEKA